MSKKTPKIAALVAHRMGGRWPAQYAAYFDCFNDGLYYEAHDVLEELWLAGGRAAPNYSYYKGLIQLAGAFVHLQKERLRPSVALFNLAEANLLLYPAVHEGCEVSDLLDLIRDWRGAITDREFAENPLRHRPPPRLAGVGA